jgi:hypothetical protein
MPGAAPVQRGEPQLTAFLTFPAETKIYGDGGGVWPNMRW